MCMCIVYVHCTFASTRLKMGACQFLLTILFIPPLPPPFFFLSLRLYVHMCTTHASLPLGLYVHVCITHASARILAAGSQQIHQDKTNNNKREIPDRRHLWQIAPTAYWLPTFDLKTNKRTHINASFRFLSLFCLGGGLLRHCYTAMIATMSLGLPPSFVCHRSSLRVLHACTPVFCVFD